MKIFHHLPIEMKGLSVMQLSSYQHPKKHKLNESEVEWKLIEVFTSDDTDLYTQFISSTLII
jgi:hypothetical protein